MKCFVLSLHRTGTKSTARFLASLGLSVMHWPVQYNGIDLREKIEGRERDLNFVGDVLAPVLKTYDCVADVPIPTLYRVLYERYCEAKFILLHRDVDDWIQSVRRHAGKRQLQAFERVQYWHYFPDEPASIDDLSDQQLEDMWRRHTSEIAEFFGGRAPSQLGVFDLYSPELGCAITEFLGFSEGGEFPIIK